MGPKVRLLTISALAFLSAGLILTFVSTRTEPSESIAARIGSKLIHHLSEIDRQVSIIKENIDEPESLIDEKLVPFFIYKNDSLTFWSSNEFVTPTLTGSDTARLRLLKTANDAFLVYVTPHDDVDIVVLITLYRQYSIRNDYLRPVWNTELFISPDIAIFDNTSSVGVPICVTNLCLFRIAVSDSFPHNRTLRIAAITFICLGLILLTILIIRIAANMAKVWPDYGFLLLALYFIAIRWSMTFFDFPNFFIATPLFDPQVFAVSSLNASLGDLLINIVCVTILCIFIFRNFFKSSLLKLQRFRFLLIVFSMLAVLFAGLFPYVVIQTLYNNSAITLDITQSLSMDGLRLIAFIVVLLSGVSSFLFSHAFVRIIASERNRNRVIAAIAIAVGLFVTINFFTEQKYVSSMFVTGCFFATVYGFRLYKRLMHFTYLTFAYLFVSIFFHSVNGAIAIQHFTRKEKIENQFRFASNFLIDRDYFGEYLLHEASQRIANDAFTQYRIMSPFLSKEPIGQKIRQHFLPSYFNKYDVEIIIFSSIGEPIESTHTGSFTELMYSYDQTGYRTERGIYFIDSPNENVTQKYALVVPIQRLNSITGYVVVELSLKKIIPENVYPELLVDHSFQQFYRTQELSYAVFANRRILFSSGDYNYEKHFDLALLGNPELYSESIRLNNYEHIAQDDQSNTVAVVSSKTTSANFILANFSFFFVLGLLVVLLLLFVQGLYNYALGRRLFFSARIQLYLNLAFFVPLIIVSVSTLSLTTQSSQQQLGAEYLNKSKVFGEQVTTYLNDYLFRNAEVQVSFNTLLAELGTLSNLDANVYQSDGVLLATSQPRIYESNLVSPYINPKAFAKIKSGENAFIESEHVGKLKYFVAYTALKSPQTGRLIGILGIPFFQSGYHLEKMQIVILSNILNIFALIFILLLVLSYFVSRWLTFPLRFITQSLRRTSLTQMNKPLSWSATDEIGLMVKEYNSMLFKLSESKSELEQTQREKAWREIAQQVAHEIKNPLTPMKLTLQQLERTLHANGGSEEKVRKAVEALLSQVDTLNEIASSFSGFAKMPEPVIKRIELVSLVRRTIDLHTPGGEIIFKTTAKEAYVMGDEQILSRTFSNLILNGLQSGRPGQKMQMAITIDISHTLARITFQDNGKGIEPHIADRVFLPHFSTKKSGSGLGLAIAKQGIEQMQGKIWFETELNRGTAFFIELPISNNS